MTLPERGFERWARWLERKLLALPPEHRLGYLRRHVDSPKIRQFVRLLDEEDRLSVVFPVQTPRGQR